MRSIWPDIGIQVFTSYSMALSPGCLLKHSSALHTSSFLIYLLQSWAFYGFHVLIHSTGFDRAKFPCWGCMCVCVCAYNPLRYCRILILPHFGTSLSSFLKISAEFTLEHTEYIEWFRGQLTNHNIKNFNSLSCLFLLTEFETCTKFYAFAVIFIPKKPCIFSILWIVFHSLLQLLVS